MLLAWKKEWRASLPRFTDKELLEIFPKTKAIIPQKIAEWKEKRDESSNKIREKLTYIKQNITKFRQSTIEKLNQSQILV